MPTLSITAARQLQLPLRALEKAIARILEKVERMLEIVLAVDGLMRQRVRRLIGR